MYFLACVFSQSSPVSSDCVMSGFLLYGDHPKTWQQTWSVVTRSEPAALLLYIDPQVGISVMKTNVNVTIAFYFQTWSLLSHILVSVCVTVIRKRRSLYEMHAVLSPQSLPLKHTTQQSPSATMRSHGGKREILLKLERAVVQLTAEMDSDF